MLRVLLAASVVAVLARSDYAPRDVAPAVRHFHSRFSSELSERVALLSLRPDGRYELADSVEYKMLGSVAQDEWKGRWRIEDDIVTLDVEGWSINGELVRAHHIPSVRLRRSEDWRSLTRLPPILFPRLNDIVNPMAIFKRSDIRIEDHGSANRCASLHGRFFAVDTD